MTGRGPLSNLPPLSPAQSRHAAAVLAAVHAALEAQGGWLSLEQYLRIVLYAPGLGYYSAGSTKFGRGGMIPVAPLNAAHVVVSDGDLGSEYVTMLRENGIEVLLA